MDSNILRYESKSYFPKLAFIAAFIILNISQAFAIPEFALWTDNKCSNCHINMQGGGMRNKFGRSFGESVANSKWEDVEWDSLASFVSDRGEYNLVQMSLLECNTLFTSVNEINKKLFFNKLSFGTDFRVQSTRSPKTDLASRKEFPMQADVYGALDAFNWLQFTGRFSIGPIVFNGQRQWSATAIIKPDSTLPALKAGFFQPTFSWQDCDMVSLDKRIATPDGTETLIAPDYAELGAEFVYESLNWLSANLGVFDATSLARVRLYGSNEPLVSQHNPSFNARLQFNPSWIWEDLPVFFIGGSFLVNGHFNYKTAYLGFPVTEEITMLFKYASANKPDLRFTENYIGGITYMPVHGLFLGFRAEHGSTIFIIDSAGTDQAKTWQLVTNARIIPLPYIELLPEYRYVKCQEYRASRWTFQVHFYY
jgi:hypothetical protein